MAPILTLIILIILGYCCWLFIRTATPYQIGRMMGLSAIIIGLGALIMLALRGRLPLALLILIILWPIMAGYFDQHRKMIFKKHRKNPDEDGSKKEQAKNDFHENS